MNRCPVCHEIDVHTSHRQNWWERGPLTWIGILPYRCGSCQTRHYRFSFRDPRRRGKADVVSPVDRLRAPRWRDRVPTRVTVDLPGVAPLILDGETENLSREGLRVRLPALLPAWSRLRIVLHGAKSRGGVVRWSKSEEPSGSLHGVELDFPFESHTKPSRAYFRLRLRRLFRRILMGLLCLALIAAVAAALFQIKEAGRNFDPEYYEPKDIERQIYELRRLIERDKEQPRP